MFVAETSKKRPDQIVDALVEIRTGWIGENYTQLAIVTCDQRLMNSDLQLTNFRPHRVLSGIIPHG